MARIVPRAPLMWRYFLMVPALGFLVGCGGSVASVQGAQQDAGSSSDAAANGDAIANGDAAASGDAISSGGGGACAGVRIPAHHRPTASSCPVARAPSNTTTCCPDASYPGQWQCSQDSDCTAGKNGRCLSNPGPAGTHCSYDECFVDSDCPGNVPCNCRTSPDSYAPNLCATGSDCRIDSDCGPCGFCSPSPDAPYPTPYVPYFCHTPADTCIDNSDCTEPSACCSFDQAKGHWACKACPVPPV